MTRWPILGTPFRACQQLFALILPHRRKRLLDSLLAVIDNPAMTYSDLIRKYGNANRAANALGFTRQALSNWKRGGIPYNSQMHIEIKTKRALRANERDLVRMRAA